MNAAPAIAFWIYLAFTSVATLYILIVSVVNFFFFRHNSTYTRPQKNPFVSVLVPARNEERDIERCIRPLLKQSYSNYEVLVLDDNSTDRTWEILENLQSESSKLKVFKSRELPPGWKGKNHALHQLTQYAEGETLICIDADMEPGADLIGWTVGNMERHRVDSLSAWPKHILPTFLEKFVVPVIYMITSFLVPLQFIRLTKAPLFSHAIGQFIAFKADSLRKIGGYECVKDRINEDVCIAREMKRAGFKHTFLDAKHRLKGNMYDSFMEGFVGIERTIYEFFDRKIYPIFILTLFLIGSVVLPPFIAIALALAGSLWAIPFSLIGFAFLFSWAITLYQRRMKWYSPFLFPIQMLMIIIIAWKSVFDMISGKGYLWKGRKVV